MSRAAQPGEVNYGWADKYTFAHFGAGLLLNLYSKDRVPFWGALAVAVGWEVLEYILKNTSPKLFVPYEGQDSAKNIVVDIAAVCFGWWLGHNLPDGQWI